MTFFLSAWAFLKKAPLWLYGALGAVLAIGWAFLRGRASGRASERQKAQERTIEQAQERKDVEDEIQGNDPGRNRDRLRGWVPGSGE